MATNKTLLRVIVELTHGAFYIQCPCCDEVVRLRECHLFCDDDFPPQVAALIEQRKEELTKLKKELLKRRDAIPRRSQVAATAVNCGKVFERLAPALADFPFERNDCRSLFDPIDYVIFEGLSCRGAVDEVVFADIKSGHASLSARQKEIARCVTAGDVSLETYDREEKP